jgi:hypothetical protein
LLAHELRDMLVQGGHAWFPLSARDSSGGTRRHRAAAYSTRRLKRNTMTDPTWMMDRI